MKKSRFVLIGGFLGAGKTTLIGELARRYTAAGKRVGIITNDQAADLVDTYNLRGQGFQVGEVAGACFCCSFDDLIATADKLSEDDVPDVLLAEPVGSCTDLVATVVLPLQQLLGDRFEPAPFGVLLKPSHGERILGGGDPGTRSGFSAQAEYIFRKQLEEADYLMIGRQDQLREEEQEELRRMLAEAADGVPVIAVSPRTGFGVDKVMELIDSPAPAGRRILEIDYDTYADGEAELGWVNMTAQLNSANPIDLNAFAYDAVLAIAQHVASLPEGEIAHLKCSVSAGDTQAVANVVDNDMKVEVGLPAGHLASGQLQVIVNARVAIAPASLEAICKQQLGTVADRRRIAIEHLSAHSLRPGRPTPTHRVTR